MSLSRFLSVGKGLLAMEEVEAGQESALLLARVLESEQKLGVEGFVGEEVVPMVRPLVQLGISLVAEDIACLADSHDMREVIEDLEEDRAVVLTCIKKGPTIGILMESQAHKVPYSQGGISHRMEGAFAQEGHDMAWVSSGPHEIEDVAVGSGDGGDEGTHAQRTVIEGELLHGGEVASSRGSLGLLAMGDPQFVLLMSPLAHFINECQLGLIEYNHSGFLEKGEEAGMMAQDEEAYEKPNCQASQHLVHGVVVEVEPTHNHENSVCRGEESAWGEGRLSADEAVLVEEEEPEGASERGVVGGKPVGGLEGAGAEGARALQERLEGRADEVLGPEDDKENELERVTGGESENGQHQAIGKEGAAEVEHLEHGLENTALAGVEGGSWA